jgi:hypothetical protein
MPCEPCNEPTRIEGQIDDLHSRLKARLPERYRQARVRRNHVHSPLIHQFPLEIAVYIFTLAFPPRDTPCCKPGKQARPLILLKVCHTWRTLALSTPNLWCNISVDANKPNFPLLNHQVKHSGRLPLSIHLFTSSHLLLFHHAHEAVPFVIKLLHRTASLWLHLPDIFIGFVTVLDCPKAAPLLEELHIHCPNLGSKGSFSLRLAIEPPRPRRVVLDWHPDNRICLDWTYVSSLTLESFRVDWLFLEVLTWRDLKLLDLGLIPEGLPGSDQPLAVHQSIQTLRLTTFNSQSSCSPRPRCHRSEH